MLNFNSLTLKLLESGKISVRDAEIFLRTIKNDPEMANQRHKLEKMIVEIIGELTFDIKSTWNDIPRPINIGGPITESKNMNMFQYIN